MMYWRGLESVNWVFPMESIIFKEFRQCNEVLTPTVTPKGFMDDKRAVGMRVRVKYTSDTNLHIYNYCKALYLHMYEYVPLLNLGIMHYIYYTVA